MGSVNEEVVFKFNNRCFTTSVITLGDLSIPGKQLSRLLPPQKSVKTRPPISPPAIPIFPETYKRRIEISVFRRKGGIIELTTNFLELSQIRLNAYEYTIDSNSYIPSKTEQSMRLSCIRSIVS